METDRAQGIYVVGALAEGADGQTVEARQHLSRRVRRAVLGAILPVTQNPYHPSIRVASSRYFSRRSVHSFHNGTMLEGGQPSVFPDGQALCKRATDVTQR